MNTWNLSFAGHGIPTIPHFPLHLQQLRFWDNYPFGATTRIFFFIALSIQCSENGQHALNMLHYTCNLISIYNIVIILLLLLLYALAALDYIGLNKCKSNNSAQAPRFCMV